MGHSFAKLTLTNPCLPELPAVKVEALADTAATFLCVPADVAEALSLEAAGERKEVVFADGRRQSLSYVGPVQIGFKGRTAFAGALVTGDRVLLGAIPMEDMDLVVSSLSRRVDVNPASPDIATCRI